MLTKASVLHYWSARYGVLPIKGGKPTFSRNSAGVIADARGELYNAIINTPRFSWETDQSTTANEWRAAMLLEQARTNYLPWSTDWSNAAWTKTSVAVATGVPDPMGGSSACTLTASAASAETHQYVAGGSSIARTNAIWARRRTGTGSVTLFAPGGSSNLTLALTSVWQRFTVSDAAPTVSRHFDIIFGTSGDAIDVWNGQGEDGAVASSDVVNFGGSTGTRAVDGASWSFTPVPQAMVVHLRFVENGTGIVNGGYGVLQLSNAGGSDAVFLVYSTSGIYTAFHSNSGGVSSGAGAGVALGETIDLVAILYPDGSVQLIQSRNGAAVTSGSRSAAKTLAAAWSAPVLTLNANTTTNIGLTKFMDVKLLKYADVVASTAQGIMDEVKAFELNGAGDQL